MKYYAVKKGFETGIFTSWEECFDKVIGYSNAEYKSFKTREEAEEYMLEGKVEENDGGTRFEHHDSNKKILTAYVDGSISDKVHAYSFGCVLIENDKVIDELYERGYDTDLLSMRNVAGEILGSRTAVEYALKNGYDVVHIYYDYKGIEEWATGGWQAKKKGTKEYRDFMKEAMKKVDIKFHKVKAHTGVKYNECADKLAKYALGIE